MAFAPRRPPVVYESNAYIPAPIQGWNPDTPPHLVPPQQAVILDNLVPQNGWVRMRSGMRRNANLTSLLSGGSVVVGGFVGQAQTYMLARLSGIGASGGPYWNAVRAQVGVTISTIAVGITTAIVSASGVTSTLALGSADVVPGRRWQSFGGTLYGISVDASTAPTTAVTIGTPGYTTKNVNLLTMPALSTPTAPTAFPTTAPRGAVDIKVYLNRIWLLGGVDVPSSGTKHSPAKLFFTNPGIGGTLGTLAADWKDPVTAASNSIELDQNVGDPGVGLAVWRNLLVIFRAHSVWVLSGNTTGTFAARVISTEVGCIDAASIVETDHGIYFMSERGFEYTDGVSIKNVSGPTYNTLRDVIQSVAETIEGGGYGYCTAVRLTDGEILITAGFYGVASSLNPLWSACYNPTTGVWWRLTSSLFVGDSSTLGNAYAGPLFPTFTPSRAIYAFGLHKATQVESEGLALVFTGDNSAYDVDGPAGIYTPIPALWRTHNLQIVTGNARRRAAMDRIFVDYGAPDTGNGISTTFVVRLYDATHTSLMQSWVLPIGGVPFHDNGLLMNTPFVQRAYNQFGREMDDAVFELSYEGPTLNTIFGNPGAAFDLYGIGIALTPAMSQPIP